MRYFLTGRAKRGIIAGTLAAGMAGAAMTGVVSNTQAVNAAPVSVTPPEQQFGFADVVEKVSPAVVSVRVSKDMAESTGAQGPRNFMSPFENLPEDHPLRRFFDIPDGNGGGGSPMPGRPGPRGGGDNQVMGQGSGFFISADGYVVTNNHVVQGGSNFTVVLDQGEEYDAELVGTDPRTDLALLKVDRPDTDFTYVRFGNDDDVRIGEWVVAVGNPFGLGGSVTAGIVSARGRDIGAGPYDDFLQIDAAVNRGNSGGPAFDLGGNVIGVNTAIFSPSGGNVGIAFAIPASVAQNVIQDLKNDGEVERGWLGVQIAPVTEDIAEATGLPDTSGAIVTMPDQETPASQAGIRTGDVITAVNGETIEDAGALARKIANFDPGASVDITYYRDGSKSDVTVELGDLSNLDQMASNQSSGDRSMPTSPSSLSGYGLTLTPSEEGDGVVVTDVDPDSVAAEKGVEPGDTIIAVNGESVASQEEVRSAIDTASQNGRNAALFQLRNDDGQNRFVGLPITNS